MGRTKKKKKKKESVIVHTATTTGGTKWWPTHIHGAWVDVGGYKVWLKSYGGQLPKEVDVYIDLTGFGLTRMIPPQLASILTPPRPIRMIWEITDGQVDDVLPDHVITLLRHGYRVGWGCTGGHGRTGWLAAKVYRMLTNCTGREAVNHIRENYCMDAVETMAQMRDLGVFDVGALDGGLVAEPIEEDEWEIADRVDYLGPTYKGVNKYLKQWEGKMADDGNGGIKVIVTEKADEQ